MKKDNCKDCQSNCEHAGKDREFVCIGGVSCKVKKQDDFVEWLKSEIALYENSLVPYNQGLCKAYQNILEKINKGSGKE